MLRIAICDDDKYLCSTIEKFIIDYEKSATIKIDVEVFYAGDDMLQFIKQEHDFDLIFLDIELGNTTGIDIGNTIRNKFDDHISKIVFITSTTGYEQQLFDVQPLNFIKKPVKYEKLKRCIDLTIKLLEKENIFFEYKKGHNIFKVNIKEILYFESNLKKVKIVTTHSKDLFYSNLQTIKEKMPKIFVEPHGSFLVNFNKIDCIKTNCLIMQNGDEIPISQRNLKNVRNMLIKFEREKYNDIL